MAKPNFSLFDKGIYNNRIKIWIKKKHPEKYNKFKETKYDEFKYGMILVSKLDYRFIKLILLNFK